MIKFRKRENYWISLSDIMTGLMVLFMFIAISYIIEIQKKQAERDEILEDFKQTKLELYKELDKEFSKDFKEKWNAILEPDLSIKFLNEKVQFDYDKSDIKPEFKYILKDFFPRYLKIILKPKYKDKIAEVRIEGHTDNKGGYIYNVKLSQDRARSVLAFLQEQDAYKNLDEQTQKRLEYWLTANGLSFGRTLDANGELTAITHKPLDSYKSRRVEFKIVTTSDKLIENILKQINSQ